MCVCEYVNELVSECEYVYVCECGYEQLIVSMCVCVFTYVCVCRFMCERGGLLLGRQGLEY
jgi:hypothetical protein